MYEVATFLKNFGVVNVCRCFFFKEKFANDTHKIIPKHTKDSEKFLIIGILTYMSNISKFVPETIHESKEFAAIFLAKKLKD